MNDERPDAWIAEAQSLRRLAARLVADSSTADDLVQETWVAAMRAPPEADRPLGAWLAHVLRNFARKQKRGDARRGEREQRAHVPREVATPDRIAERLDSQRVLIEVVKNLAEPLRTTVVLRYFEDLSSAQIARVQGVPEGTVRWRLKRALDELRVELDGRFGGSRGAWCALLMPIAMKYAPVAPPPTSAAAGLVTTEGAIAVGTMTKIGIAFAVVALGGIAWWSVETESAPPLASSLQEASAPAPSHIDAAEAMELAAADVAGTAARRAESAPRAETEPKPAPAVTAAPTEYVDQLVEVRFVATNGVPWEGVRFWRVTEEENAVTSGADGRARLVMRHGDPPPSLHMDFVATRAGCASASLGATVHRGETTHLGDIVLVGSIELRGRVVDAEGRGVGDARVGLSGVDLREDDLGFLHRRGSEAFDQSTTVACDARGDFAMKSVAPGKWRLWAAAEGKRHGWTEPFEVASDTHSGFEIVLEPLRRADRLIGQVVDPKGEGVPNANLLIHYQQEHESGTMSDVADERGRFEFVIWRDTSYTIVGWDPENRFAEGSIENATAGDELVLRLAEPTTMNVRVHGAEDQPLEGVEITVAREKPDHGAEAHVSALGEGRYRLALPAYAASVNIKATGHRPRVFGPFEPGRTPATLDAALEPLPIVRGTVVAGGRPLAGAKVGIFAAVRGTLNMNGFDCLTELSARETATTDDKGEFRIGCDLDGEFYVRADAEGFASGELGPLTLAKSDRLLEIEVTRGGAIEGRVLLADGSSGEGAIVGINRGDGRARTGRAGAGGVYRFEGLTPGRWQVLPRSQEVRPDRSFVMSDDQAEDTVIEWSCEVVAGKTTTFDVVGDAK